MYIAEAAILVRKAVAYSIGSSLLDNVIDHGLRLENRDITQTGVRRSTTAVAGRLI